MCGAAAGECQSHDEKRTDRHHEQRGCSQAAPAESPPALLPASESSFAVHAGWAHIERRILSPQRWNAIT